MFVFVMMANTPQIILEKVKSIIKDEILSGAERDRQSFIKTDNFLGRRQLNIQVENAVCSCQNPNFHEQRTLIQYR